ncbi:hypothetical protein T4B_7237 [Trichinella pseudospiralis]|uniref:Uncharacterized protein n=1 Tax=Trichinella pseudospiralis TaxID=6337 RepID=A0A0V1J5Z2_TRIPS|nr:hypothetical protein T4B_7237 [Trichinella pseudospiralis]
MKALMMKRANGTLGRSNEGNVIMQSGMVKCDNTMNIDRLVTEPEQKCVKLYICNAEESICLNKFNTDKVGQMYESFALIQQQQSSWNNIIYK